MSQIPREKGIFCNRTLNLRSIEAIGYDMDYTLIHYDMAAWEERAYAYLREGLKRNLHWPVDDLAFDPDLAMQGLIVDTQTGNVLKANRFGYVKRVFHGTKPMDFTQQRDLYQGTLIDLHDDRWKFMNTLFSISEACMYMQLVELLDAGKLPPSLGYENLYRHVREVLDEAHLEGLLKQEIIDHPERFVQPDPDVPLTLLDQKEAGKKVMLITNSEWSYAAPMLSYVFDPHLPGTMTWRDLFHYTIVGARKPDFFSSRSPVFEVVNEEGLLREHRRPLQEGGIYVGGNAALVERSLGLTGEKILYVGDHIFSDVKVSKALLRWRTALIIRELEDEIRAIDAFEEQQYTLSMLMHQKEELESEFSALRLERQRNVRQYGPQTDRSPATLDAQLQELRRQLVALDEAIGELAVAAGELHNPNWGLLMHAGNDKSHFARQLEHSADIYMSRVSNFLNYTPFVYLRSFRGSLPHSPMDQSDYSSLAK
ncbi:MAG: HAD-IG family 5'-nucleotidase [Rhodothermales bacterium]